jgi:hypothetical protein
VLKPIHHQIEQDLMQSASVAAHQNRPGCDQLLQMAPAGYRHAPCLLVDVERDVTQIDALPVQRARTPSISQIAERIASGR